MQQVLSSVLATFKSLHEQDKLWTSLHKNMSVSSKNLTVLLEHRDICKKVNLYQTALHKFPNIKDDLLYKIDLKIESEINDIESCLEELNKVKNEVTGVVSEALECHNKHASNIKNTEFINGTARVPPLSYMIEALQDISLFYTVHCQLYNAFSDERNIQLKINFKQLLSEDEKLRDKIHEIFAVTSLFVEEGIT